MSRAGSSHARVAEVLERAMEVPRPERSAFVRGACLGEPAIEEEVRSLMCALERSEGFLSPPELPRAELLTAGERVGPFEVRERLGAGGMGVVYRAHDTRLDRSVALKVLLRDGAMDAARRARFDREARTLAALNHPNIGAIFGIEDAAGASGPILVLELVHGGTLAQRIGHGAIPLDESIPIACAICRALEAAHNAGVVHRDLKPGNVMLSTDGVVKVVDFGLAKVHDDAHEQSNSAQSGAKDNRSRADKSRPSAVPLITQAGLLVGTAAYMSPEQARGRPTDKRADMWALGCVLFEMLAGVRAFPGDDAGEVLARVVRADADWIRLPTSTPVGVRRVIEKCLRLDPDQRLRDAGDARIELEEAMMPQGIRRQRPRWIVPAIAAASVGLVACVVTYALRGERPSPPIRASLRLPEGQLLSMSYESPIRFSPDGRVIYATASPRRSRASLYSRSLGGAEFSRVLPDGAVIAEPSADGSRIVCWSGVNPQTLTVYDNATQLPITTSPVYHGYHGGHTWIDDERVLVCHAGSIANITIWNTRTGEETRRELENGVGAWHPSRTHLPGQVLYTRVRTTERGTERAVWLYDVAKDAHREVMPEASMARLGAADLMFFYRDAAMWGMFVDPRTLTPHGVPAKLLDGLQPPTDTIPRAVFDVSSRGDLAYVPGTATFESTGLDWVDANGKHTKVHDFGRRVWAMRLSHDSTRVAVVIMPPNEVRVLDLVSGHDTRVVGHDLGIGLPVWSRDGEWIYYNLKLPGDNHELWRVRSDGASPPIMMRRLPQGVWADPTDVTPDGKYLVAAMLTGREEETDLFLFPLEGDAEPIRLLSTSADRTNGRFSPDGRLLAFTSNETGRAEVYVRPYPELDRQIRVSPNGGFRVSWAAQGSRLGYRYGDTLEVVDITRQPTLSVSRPLVSLQDLPESRFDCSPDGLNFLMSVPAGGSAPADRVELITDFVRDARKKIRAVQVR